MTDTGSTQIRSAILLTLLGTLLLVTSGCDTRDDAASAQRENPEPHLVELNAHLFERLLLHHDPAPYRETALPEYRFVASIGIVENLDEVTTDLDNLAVRVLHITNEETLLRGSTAVLIGTMHMEGSVLGYPLPEDMRYMSVFVHEDGEWRLLSRSLTPVDDPRPPGTGDARPPNAAL
jgi:hypothetical protein